MADIGKVRIRIPSSIKPGEVVQVRTLVIHPMERIERDREGRIIPKTYNYINKVIVTYLGKTIVTFDTTQSVSENPFFSDRKSTRLNSSHVRISYAVFCLQQKTD